MKRLAWLCSSVIGVALISACGAGGGGGSAVTPITSPAVAPASVQFVVTLGPTSVVAVDRRHPKFTAPAGTGSLSFTLTSVNGSAAAAAPTTFNFSGAACTPAVNPTSCTFTVQAPVGTDVFTITTYAQANEQGAPTGSGSVTVTATAGQTTTAPTTLSGTVASIELSLPTGVAPEGNTTTLPLTVVAKDANGNVIIGTFTNSITLTDADTSGQTTLSSTTLNDANAAAAVTFTYKGGVMAAAAALSASATGVTTVIGTTFLPDRSLPIVNGATLIYGTTSTGINGGGSFGPTPPPGLYPPPLWGPLPVTPVTVSEYTNASFNGQNGVIEVIAQEAPSPGPAIRVDSYYQWTTSSTQATLAYLGSQQIGGLIAMDGTDQYGEFGNGSATTTCAAPYQTAWIIPLPASWDGLSHTGACSETASSQDGSLSGTETLNADGSYASSTTELPSTLASSATAKADGTASGWFMYGTGTGMPPVITDYAVLVNVGTPQPNSTSIPATVTTMNGPIPSPGASTPAPVATSFPNWYFGAGFTNGVVPQPLRSTAYSNKGAVTTLPTPCAVPTSVTGTNPSFTEIDAAHVQADPLGTYELDSYQYFNESGIGVVCALETSRVNNATYLYMPNPSFIGTYAAYAAYLTSSTLASAAAHPRNAAAAMHLVQAGLFGVLRAHDASVRSRYLATIKRH